MVKQINSAHGGDGWIGRQTNHINEIGSLWTKCGVVSETDILKHVILHRPKLELNEIKDPQSVLWDSLIEIDKAQYQHDVLAQTYLDYGIKVDYIDSNTLYPNLMFMRDTFTMTKQGAIISRMASDVRMGEEIIISRKLANLGVPIIASAHDDMLLEGPDILLVNKDLAFLGVGLRTNYEAVQFVEKLLLLQGYSEVKIIQTTYGCGHLDGVINLLNSKNAVIVPQRASYDLYTNLKRHGFNIIELSDTKEVDSLMSINFVTLDSENILINKGSKEASEKYRKYGVNCIEIDVSELMKGGGSVHCLTGVLNRI